MSGFEQYAWLVKSEPRDISVDEFLALPEKKMGWFGIRNYQARNFMRDACKVGDPVLFYHSSCKEPGIVGVGRIASAPYPDPTQFDESNKYFDPKATQEVPRWMQVDIELLYKIHRISLAELRADPALSGMVILRKGNRLSISPVTRSEWDAIRKMMKKW